MNVPALSADPEVTEKTLLVFPANGQWISDDHSNFSINKPDIVDTNDIFLMYASEMIWSKFFQELLKALSYSKGTAIYEFKTYMVLFRCRIDDLLFQDHLTNGIFSKYQKWAVLHANGK